MGAIKDLVDLVAKLIKSVKNREFAAELLEIQRMIITIQAEHATIHQKNIDLMNENEQLRRKITTSSGISAHPIGNLPDGMNSVFSRLNNAEFIAPLKTAERSFLQVLVSQFSLNRSDKGVKLDISFDDDALAIWSRHGKRDLESIVLDGQLDKVENTQTKLNSFLIEGEGGKPKIGDDDEFYYRYGSGGVLPIVRINENKYYCLIYREINPIGWNIANGGTDSREELLEPAKAMMRELNEELIIIELDKKRRYSFGNSPEMPEFYLVRKLIKSFFDDLNWDKLDVYQPSIEWVKGPDEVCVRIGDGAKKRTDNCFVNINATDLGIEIDRIAMFDVDESAIFIDGELNDGELPGFQAVNAPIGLFEVNRTNELVKTKSKEYEPDIIFWSGLRYNGNEAEEVIKDKFILSVRANMSEKEYKDFCSNKEFLNLCPVTNNIVNRYMKISS